MRQMGARAVCVSVLLVGTTAVLLGARFQSTYRAPDVDAVNFADKKVAALVITTDKSIEAVAEDQLAAELTARGAQGVAAWRVVPRETLQDTDRTSAFFARASIDGVLAIRVMKVERPLSYLPDMWDMPHYASLWGYYGYGWSRAIGFGELREDTVVTIEALAFSVRLNRMIWAGMSEVTPPSGARKLLKDLAKEATKEMAKQGLIVKR